MIDWYYVEDRERVGPVSEEKILSLVNSGSLDSESFLWRKGFEDWKKLEDISELAILFEEPLVEEVQEASEEFPAPSNDLPPFIVEGIDWDNIDHNEAIFTVKIGQDRGGNEVEYGPYSLVQLSKAFEENRINNKTFIFSAGMENWILLSEIPIYAKVFQALPPAIEEDDRRKHTRKPFVARMFFHDNREVFEGICRDVSIGGLQILVSGYPAELNEDVTLNVHPENTSHNFVAKGKVVRILDGDQGFSLRFNELSDEAENAILNYIQSI